MINLLFVFVVVAADAPVNHDYDFQPCEYAFTPARIHTSPVDDWLPAEAADFSVLLETFGQEEQAARPAAPAMLNRPACANGRCFIAPDVTMPASGNDAMAIDPTVGEFRFVEPRITNPKGYPAVQSVPRAPAGFAGRWRPRTIFGNWLSRWQSRFQRR